jgi:hypothetical protein
MQSAHGRKLREYADLLFPGYFRRGVMLPMFGLLPSADHCTWIRKDPPASIGPELTAKIEAASQKIVAERRDGKSL